MKNKILWITSGIPGCGKSTWIRNKISEIGGTHISRDAIRFSLLNDFDDYFAKETQVFEIFISKIQEALDTEEINPNIFVDATHLNEISLNKVLDRLNLSNTIQINLVDFNIPLNVALERNELRAGRSIVPRGQIRRMFEQKATPKRSDRYNFNIITITEEE